MLPSSDDYECIPLKKRLKLLLASCHVPADSQVIGVHSNAGNTVVERKGDKGCQSQSGCAAEVKIIETVSTEERRKSVECNRQEGLAPADTFKVEHADNRIKNPSTGQRSGSSQVASEAVHLETEMLDELDHLVLKERLRRLLTRKLSGLVEMPLEENRSGISVPASATIHLQTSETGKGELTFGDQQLSVDVNQNHEIHATLESETSKCRVNPSSKTTKVLFIERNDRTCSSQTNLFKHESNGTKALLSGDITTMQHDAAPKLASIKVEPPNYYELEKSNQYAAAPDLTNIKVEPLNYCELQSSSATTEVEIDGDYEEDKLDHLLLRERMKLLSRKNEPSFNISQSSKCKNQIIESALHCTPLESRSAESVKVNRLRKRRKTATDSIETAMEEDAPGLLQVLIEKGVSVDEIKLYGEPESNDALDDVQSQDSFAELEEVIAKLFSRRESLLKFGPLRCSKGEKASYCLECLFSLVEQARYLRFRNWPVEWGWCRDLQSFIFVFERHNRIVLERPEYGYATYFFELAESLPISWQIKRLVTAMKLTSCSRITVLENKALKVGDDLSEGEARVLMEYGWTLDTGLGTMLNYYDRVVHDRKNEKNVSEWRSKIGKLLMDGYNGGTVICTSIPKKVMEYNVADPVQIKLELD